MTDPIDPRHGEPLEPDSREWWKQVAQGLAVQCFDAERALSVAWTDIKEWIRLAREQRAASDDPDHAVNMPSVAGIQKSERICEQIGRVMDPSSPLHGERREEQEQEKALTTRVDDSQYGERSGTAASNEVIRLMNEEARDLDEDGHPTPWCLDVAGHSDGHEFCGHHQISWCRLCDKDCPACVDDPRCPDCGCAMFEEYHDWDCCYDAD